MIWLKWLVLFFLFNTTNFNSTRTKHEPNHEPCARGTQVYQDTTTIYFMELYSHMNRLNISELISTFYMTCLVSFQISWKISLRGDRLKVYYRFCQVCWNKTSRKNLDIRVGNFQYNISYSIPTTRTGENFKFEDLCHRLGYEVFSNKC